MFMPTGMPVVGEDPRPLLAVLAAHAVGPEQVLRRERRRALDELVLAGDAADRRGAPEARADRALGVARERVGL
jgi:hypothetical protein